MPKHRGVLSGAVRAVLGDDSLWSGDGSGATTAAVLERLGLERAPYFLYVSRMEPENNALLVRESFEKLDDAAEAGADRRRALRGGLYPRGCAILPIRAW